MPASEAFSISFHRTQEGLLSARVGEHAFLVAPSKAGGVCVLSAHRLDTPPQKWRATTSIRTALWPLARGHP
jgi:hypothetical protein